MMKKNKNILIFLSIGIVLVIVTSMLFAFNKTDEYKELPKVKLKENKELKEFALMLEQGNGEYKKSDEAFPTEGYTFNQEKSGCTDINGKIIDGALNYDYDSYTIILNTDKTSYCYLYYDIEPNISYLRSKDIDSHLSKELTGGLYRYQGTYTKDDVGNVTNDVENYICFGTNDKDVCLTNQDKYLYRIIGIRADGSLKLIKKEALDKGFQWYSNDKTNIKWPQSNIYQAINDNEYLNNENYLSADWKNKIITKKWLYGDIMGTNSNGTSINQSGIGIYKMEAGKENAGWYEIESDTHETGDLNANGESIICSTTTSGTEIGKKICYSPQTKLWTDEIEAKIGLMYVHDYYLSYNNEINCFYSQVKCADSWINLKNNDSNAINYNEWTMTRYGYVYWWNYFSIQGIYETGTVYDYIFRGGVGNYAVRPVFYTISDIELTGEGTIIDPFRII